MATVESLHSLMIPMWEEPLLLPDTAVAEVIGFAYPEGSSQQPWHLGEISWRGLYLPVICLEHQIPDEAALGRSARIAILNSVTGNEAQPFTAILINGIPRLLNVSSDELELAANDADKGMPMGIMARVHIGQQYARIPDLDRIEAMSLQVSR
jgi:chemosensory pili system protein ChpC